jgi:hypothetical protein
MAGRGDGLYRQGEKSENVTNEANFDENVVITQNGDPIAVAAISGVDSGLDKRGKKKERHRDIKMTARNAQAFPNDSSRRSQSSLCGIEPSVQCLPLPFRRRSSPPGP